MGRKHEKNIGKKVYFCCEEKYNKKIYEGLLVGIYFDEKKVRIYCFETNETEVFYLKQFNNIKCTWWNDKSWGYTDKNVKEFYEHMNHKDTKPQINYRYIHFSSDDVCKYCYLKFLEFLKIDLQNNEYKNRYKKELGKFFEYFSVERNFKILDVYENKWDSKSQMQFCIRKEYYDDETKPIGVQILFQYRPFGKYNDAIRIHKFDEFVKTYEIIEGKGYNAN